MRDQFIDANKGILIFLVVFGHFLERIVGWVPDESRVLLSSIYAIHMPAFVFISGTLFNNTNIVKKLIYFLSLLLPFQLLYLLLDFYLTGHWNQHWWDRPYWILWYLLAMMGWTVLTPLLLKTKFPLLLSISAALLIGYSPLSNYLFSIGRIFTFLPFFVLGYLYGKNIIDYIKRHPNSLWAGLGIVTAILLFFYFYPLHSGWLYGSYRYVQLTQQLDWVLLTRLGLMFIATLGIVALISLTPLFHQRWINLGKNTLSVYLLHGVVVMLFAHFFQLNYALWIQILLCLLLSVVTCWVFQKDIFHRVIEKISKFIRLEKGR